LGYGPRLTKPKAAVLAGKTAENGKNQFLDPIHGLLPPGAVSSLPLGKFGEDRYVVQLAGKLLNASDELSSAAPIQTDAFKKNHHWRAEQGAMFTAAPSHTAPSHSSLIEIATR
jgi:hypothetical protein